MRIEGAFIAPATPIDTDGNLNLQLWDDLVAYLLNSGVDGLVIGGTTSEYTHFDLDERNRLVTHAAQAMQGRARLLVSIGSSSYSRVLELGSHAASAGAEAVLLPMPHFFHYEDDDLAYFCRTVSRNLPLPCLLYNIPIFTNPLKLETVVRLLDEEPGFIGIKDSSGSRRALGHLVDALHHKRERVSLLMGQDQLIYDSLTSGWDGFVSGLGNLCPEMVTLLYQSFRNGDLDTARACQTQLTQLADRFVRLPAPWAVRIGLQSRGLDCGPTSLPVSPMRRLQVEEFVEWYTEWLAQEVHTLVKPIPVPVRD